MRDSEVNVTRHYAACNFDLLLSFRSLPYFTVIYCLWW